MDGKVEFQRGGIALRILFYLILIAALSAFIVWRKNQVLESRNAEIISIFSEWQKNGVPVNAMKLRRTDLNIYARTTAERRSDYGLLAYCTLDLKNKLAQDQPVTAYTGSSEIKGRVFAISTSRNVSNGLFPVQFKVGSKLPTNGQKVHVEIITKTHRNRINVPVESILREDEKTFVYKIAEGKAIKTFIKTSATNGFNTEVTSGLKTGDIIVTDGLSKIDNGTKVNIRTCEDC